MSVTVTLTVLSGTMLTWTIILRHFLMFGQICEFLELYNQPGSFCNLFVENESFP